jgi:hypothetical protein
MTGETEPSQDTLKNYLVKRVLAVEGREGLERRYNRRNADDTVLLEKRYNTWGVPEPASPPVGNTLAETSGDPLGAQPNGVTAANKPTANNSLGLDIEQVHLAISQTFLILFIYFVQSSRYLISSNNTDR